MFIVLGGVALLIDNIQEIETLTWEDTDSERGKYKARLTMSKGQNWRTRQKAKDIQEAMRCARDPEYAHWQELKWALDRIKEAEERVDNVLDSPSVKRLPAGAIKKLKEASQILNSKITVGNRMAVGYIR